MGEVMSRLQTGVCREMGVAGTGMKSLRAPGGWKENGNKSCVSTKQSGSVQFSSLHIRTVIFVFPLSKVVDGTKRTAPYFFSC